MTHPVSAARLPPSRITDVHIHIQPWRELKPQVLAVMWRDKEAERDLMVQLMEDPRALLQVMDRSGVWRAGLVNYPSPDVMGFTDATNMFSATYARANPERLLPYGGVLHPAPPPPRPARHLRDSARPPVGVLSAPARGGRPRAVGNRLAQPGRQRDAPEHRSVPGTLARRLAQAGHSGDQCAGSVPCCSLARSPPRLKN